MKKVNIKVNLKSKKIISNFIFAFLCLLWLISFIKAPIVGKLIDAIFFEFLFGYAKIIIYLLTLIMLISWYYKNFFFTLFSKRKDLSYLLIIIFACLCLGIASYFYNNQNYQNSSFKDFFVGTKNSFFDKWIEQNINNLLDIKNSFLVINKYAFGGLIGTLYVALTNQTIGFVMFFSLILIFIIFSFVSILCWSDKVLYFIKIKILKCCGEKQRKDIEITNKLIISSNSNFESKKQLLLEKIKLDNEQIQIIDDCFNITLNNKNQITETLNSLNELEIKKIKIVIKNNEF